MDKFSKKLGLRPQQLIMPAANESAIGSYYAMPRNAQLTPPAVPPTALRIVAALHLSDNDVALWADLSRQAVGHWRTLESPMSLKYQLLVGMLTNVIYESRRNFLALGAAADEQMKAALPKNAPYDPAWRKRWTDSLDVVWGLISQLDQEMGVIKSADPATFREAYIAACVRLAELNEISAKQKAGVPSAAVISDAHKLKLAKKQARAAKTTK